MGREERGSSLAETVSTNSPQCRQTSQGSPLNKVQPDLRNDAGFLQPCLDVKPIRSLWLNHNPQQYRLVTGKKHVKACED